MSCCSRIGHCRTCKYRLMGIPSLSKCEIDRGTSHSGERNVICRRRQLWLVQTVQHRQHRASYSHRAGRESGILQPEGSGIIG